MKKISIEGMLMNILIEEINHVDRGGKLLCYIARIYVQDTLQGRTWHVRTSRLPGSAALIENELRKSGRTALDRLRRS